MKKLMLPLMLLVPLASLSQTATQTAAPEGNIYARWSAQTNRIQGKQPSWSVPVITTYTGLFQVVRADFVRQIAPARTYTWNYDNSKCVSFITPGNLEFDVNMVPYITHDNPKVVDGWGDFSFLAKYRIASGNAKHGNYVMSAWALTTVPTGQAKNGSTNASVAPTFGLGKGIGHFDVQTTAGVTLPTGTPAITTSGRPIVWNTAAQYHIGKIWWPEVESNATYFRGGTNSGKNQEFLAPGLMVGKIGLHPADPKSRPGLAFGGAMQIATSKFHSYNHSLIMSVRWIY